MVDEFIIEVEDQPYSEELCNEKNSSLFVFGDNTIRQGIGGQAKIRRCPNVAGIATKFSPMTHFSDKNYIRNRQFIDQDIENIKKIMRTLKYDSIIFPKSGLGWGRADMQNKCPRTSLYLTKRLLDEFGFNNLQDLVNSKQF